MNYPKLLFVSSVWVITIFPLALAGTETDKNPIKIYSVSKAKILEGIVSKSNQGLIVTSYTAVPQALLTSLKKDSKLESNSSQQKRPSISVSIYEAGETEVPNYPEIPQEIVELEDNYLPRLPRPLQVISNAQPQPHPLPIQPIYYEPYPFQPQIQTTYLKSDPHPEDFSLKSPPPTLPNQSLYSIPQYNYAYQVHDAKSGNNQGHSEYRNGDSVIGQYSVLDPDGIFRVVSYTSDPVNGFKAIVNRQTSNLMRRSIQNQSPSYRNAYTEFPYFYANSRYPYSS